ncbi:hypothetical protein SAMN05660489_04552 [Pseudomonas sp. LAMO17WK12:I10]|uniref:hypothetical protein n=1 Tax=unclassified Pseudomonas TaxID=196821 RepID=UPI000BD6F04A|nr:MULTISPECIES: hypothetical protein [unclassified Pseudomonas]PXX59527.1 hypothetical protein H160_04647 [Pseudomonas sp. LAMO17WK12:I9]SNY46738.1 hypothetical protein SAMN05660489_04552 [Pseudomonas sp. LAMO17WK12:I10]
MLKPHFYGRNHLAYITALTPTLILAMSIGLGLSKDNWFLEFGLAIVVVSTATSMSLAFLGGRKATQAKKVEFESFLPEVDEGESSSFRYSSDIMGVDTSNPIKHLQNQIDDIKRVTDQDERNFKSGLSFNEARIDSCLAQIRYHEEVTLPKILGQGSGAIILAGALTIIGSAYLAFPGWLYNTFSLLANVLMGMVSAR